MVVRLFLLLSILLSGVVLSSTDATAQTQSGNGAYSGELKLYDVNDISSFPFANGTTQIVWEFDFDSNQNIFDTNVFVGDSIKASMFQLSDQTLNFKSDKTLNCDDPIPAVNVLDCATRWHSVRLTPTVPANDGKLTVGSTGGGSSVMNFNAIFRVTSETTVGHNSSGVTARFKPVADFPSGVDVRRCDPRNCTFGLVSATDAALTPTVAPTAQTHTKISSQPLLTVTRGQSNNAGADKTKATVGNDIVWNLNFSGATGTPSFAIADIDLDAESSQFEIRPVPANSAIPNIDVRLTAGSDAGKFVATGRLITASDSTTQTYGLFTKSDYAPSIRNANGGAVFNNGSLVANTDLSSDASDRFTNLPPPPRPTLASAIPTGAGSADAGDKIRWNLTFTQSAPTLSTIDVDGTSDQFEVRYNDGTTNHTIEVNVRAGSTPLLFTVESEALPALIGTNNFSLFTKSTYTPPIAGAGGTARFGSPLADLAADIEITPTAPHQITNIPPPAPALTVVRKNSTQGVRKPDEVTWTLTFTNSPSGILLDDTQFVARAIDGSGALIPTSTIPAIDVTLTADTAGSIYTATGTIANSNTDTTITYGLFNKIDLHAAITTTGGGLQFAGADLTTPLTPLTPAATNRYNNLAPLIPVLTLTRTGADASVGSGVALTWNFAFTNDPGPADGNNTDGITIGVSDQFHVCFGSGQSLALTLAGTASPYTATSAVTSALGGVFNYHVCTIDNADDNANDIGTPSDGVINYTTTESTYTNIGDEITSGAKSYANDPPAAPNITNVSIVAPQRKTAAGDVQWTITFAAGVQGVDKDEFTINNGGTVTNVTPTTGNSFTVTANVTVTPTTDTDIHLTRIANSTIQLSDGSNVGYPASTPARVLTTTGANNHFILNTDTTRPTIGARADIIRVDTDGSSANGQRVTAAGNIRWRVTFDSPVYGVGTEDFRVVVEGASAVVPNDVVFTDGNDFAVVVFAAQGTPTTDTNINLDFHTAISIADSTDANGNQNAFQVPGFATNRRLTDATNNYVFNTDTSAPTLTVVRDTNERIRDTRTATWRLEFSEAVTGIQFNDFTISGANNNPALLQPLPASSGVRVANQHYNLQVDIDDAPTTDTRVNLSIISGHGITREGGNATPFSPSPLLLTDNSNNFILNVDVAAPAVSGQAERINTPRIAGGGVDTAIWDVTFDLAVSEPPAAAFEIRNLADSSVITQASGISVSEVAPSDGTKWRITADTPTTGHTTDIDVNLALASGAVITRAPGNNPIALTAGLGNSITDQNYILNTDTTAPTVNSLNRVTPERIRGTGTATWRIEFTHDVDVNADGSDFTDTRSSNIAVTPNPASQHKIFDIVVTFTGTNETDQIIHLNLASGHSISRRGGNTIAFNPADNELTTGGGSANTFIYNTDVSRPEITSITTPTAPDRLTALGGTITYAVTFSEPIKNIGAGDFELQFFNQGTNTLNPAYTQSVRNSFTMANPAQVGSTDVYNIVVTVPDLGTVVGFGGIESFGDSDIRLALASGTDIQDNNNNDNAVVTDTPATNEDYQLDPDFTEPLLDNIPTTRTADTILRPARRSGNTDIPANLIAVWENITFSHNVTGVDADDFQLVFSGVGNDVDRENQDTGYTFSVTGTGSVYSVTATLPITDADLSDTNRTVDLRLLNTNSADRDTNPDSTPIRRDHINATPFSSSHTNEGAVVTTHTSTRIHNPDASRPTITSITTEFADRVASLGEPINWNVTFSEPVKNVTPDDFEIEITGTGITFPAISVTSTPAVTGMNNTQFSVRATVPNLTAFTDLNPDITLFDDGNLTLRAVDGKDIQDSNGNDNDLDTTSPTTNQPYQLNPDFTTPTVTATRTNAARTFGEVTTTAVWQVTFTHDVENIDANGDDFDVNNSTTIEVTNIQPRSATVTATLDTTTATSGDVDVDLSIATGSDIRRTGVNGAFTSALVATGQIQHATPATDISYILNTDVTRPTLTIASVNPATRYTSGGNIVYNLTFGQSVTNVSLTAPETQFQINADPPITGTVSYTMTSTSSTEYQLTVALPSDNNDAGTKFNLQYIGTADQSGIRSDTGNQMEYRALGSGDIEAAGSRTLVTLATGTPALSTITASPRINPDGTGVITFTITFATPVNMQNGNIQLRNHLSTSNLTNFTLAASGGATSPYRGDTETIPFGGAQDGAGTFSTTWTLETPEYTTTTAATATLTIISFGQIDTIGTRTITEPALASRMLLAPFVAVPPIVNSVTRVATTHHSGEDDRTEGGTSNAISWIVEFDQAVSIGSANAQTVLTPAVFAVVNTGNTSPTDFVISAVADNDTPAENTTFRVTATLPDDGFPADENIHLAIRSGSDIHGSLGATDASTPAQIRRPIESTTEGIITSTTDVTNRFILNTDTRAPVATVTRSDSRVERVFDNNTNDRILRWDVQFDLGVENISMNGTDFEIRVFNASDGAFVRNILLDITATETDPNNVIVEYTIADSGFPNDSYLDLYRRAGISGSDIRRNAENHIRFRPANDRLTTDNSRYIYNSDVTAPTVSGVTFDPADRFYNVATEDITWTVEFSHNIEGFAATQFEIRDESGTNIGTNLAIGTYDSTNNRLPVTGRPVYTEPTKISLHYVGTGNDVISRVGGNEIQFAAENNQTLQATPALYALAVGEPAYESLAGEAVNSTGRVTFRVNFASRVANFTHSNFHISSHETTGTDEIDDAAVTITPVSGSDSVYQGDDTLPSGETGDPANTMFASEWTVVTTVANTDAGSVTLVFDNISGINPEGPATAIDALPATNPSLTQRFVATPPTVLSATRVSSHTNVTGQNDISWLVTFNQGTIQVDAADFEIVDAAGNAIEDDNGTEIVVSIDDVDPSGTGMGLVDPDDANSGMVPEATAYTITASLPDSGVSGSDRTVHLRIASGNNILGASGSTSESVDTLRRVAFGTTPTIVTTSAAFTYRTLAIESVSFEAFEGTTTGDQLSGGSTGNPFSRPNRVEWTVTYNIAPTTGITTPTQAMLDAYYDITCTGADCTSVVHSVATSGNTHVITATVFPNRTDDNNDTAVTAVLGLGTSLNTANTDINPADETGATIAYHNSLEADVTVLGKTPTQLFYRVAFNTTSDITGLILSEISLEDGGTRVTTGTIAQSSPTDADRIVTVTFPDAADLTALGGLLSLKIDDTDDRDNIRLSTDSNRRAFNADADGSSYMVASTPTSLVNIDSGASAPVIDSVTIVDSTGAAISSTDSHPIDGDAADDNTPDTYNWKVVFDQPLTVITTGVTNQFGLRLRDTLGDTPIAQTLAALDDELTVTQGADASEYIVSFTPGLTGVEEQIRIDLVVLPAASTITGAERIDATDPDPNNLITMTYVVPDANSRELNDDDNSYILRNRARWLSLNSSGYDTDSGSPTFGDITYRAVFSRQVSAVAVGSFTVVDSPASLNPTVGTPVGVGNDPSDMWDIPIETTNFTSAYTGFVTLTGVRGTITDSAGNAISQHVPDPSVHRYLATNPTITSVARTGDERVGMGATAPLTVEWTVTFNQGTIAVDASDFEVAGITGSTITDVTAMSPSMVDYTNTQTRQVSQANTYTIEATLPITGFPDDTEVHLSIVTSNDIEGSAGATSETNTVQRRLGIEAANIGQITDTADNNHFILNTDNDAPSVMANVTTRGSGVSQYTRGGPGSSLVSWNITFSEPVKNVAPTHFEIAGVTGATIQAIDPAAPTTNADARAEYIIVAQLPTTGHDAGIDIDLSFTTTAIAILDRNDNPLDITSTAVSNDNSGYILDTDPPTLMSITGTSPDPTSRSVDWVVIFNEPVGSVTNSSFTITDPAVSSITSPPVPSGPINGLSTNWTFTTENSGRYGGTTTVTEKIDSGIVNVDNFPVISNSTPMEFVHTFPAANITGIVSAVLPTQSRTGADAATSIGNLTSIAWTVTYDDSTPDPDVRGFTYRVCVLDANDACTNDVSQETTTNADNTVHTITVTDFPNVEGRLTLTNGNDPFVTIAPTGNVLFVDTIAPSLLTLVPNQSNNSWVFTFSEPVFNFGSDNFEFSSTVTPTITGSGTEWTVTIPSQSSEVTLSFKESTRDDMGVVTGATDASGNPLSGRRINGVLLPTVEEIEERTQELITDFVEYQATQIITNTPSLSFRTARASIPGGRRVDVGSQNFTADVSDDSSEMKYSGNFVSLWPENIVGSEFLGDGGEFWTNITYAVSEFDNGSKTNSFFSTSGIDFVTDSDLIWGLLMQIDISDQSGESTVLQSNQQTYTSDIESLGWLSGYYAVYGVGDFSLEGRVAIGGSSVHVSPFGTGVYTDQYDTERVLLSGGVTRNGYSRRGGKSWSFIPSIDYTYYAETSDAYTDGSGGPNGQGMLITGMEYKLNRLEFNQTITKAFTFDEDTLVPSFGFAGIYDTSSISSRSDFDEDFKARLDAGVVYTGDSGIDWNVALYYEGIGTSNKTYGLSLGLGVSY